MCIRDRARPSRAGRRPGFLFSAHGVPAGAELELRGRPDMKATVLDDGRILCEDESGELNAGTLTSFAKLHLGLDTCRSAARYWSYNGVRLSDL